MLAIKLIYYYQEASDKSYVVDKHLYLEVDISGCLLAVSK